MVVKPGFLLTLYRKFFAVLSLVLLFFLAILFVLHFIPGGLYDRGTKLHHPISLENIDRAPEFTVVEEAPVSAPRNSRCSYWDCFNVYRCGNKGKFILKCALCQFDLVFSLHNFSCYRLK